MSKRQRRDRAKRRRHEARHPGRTKVVAGTGLALGATLGIAGTAQAADFTVTNLNDSGAGSLRQAVIDANNNPGADRVLFQSGLTGTIELTSNQLSISDPVDIQGPGAGTLTVRGAGTNRVAYVYPGDGQSVTVSGLTLSGNGNTTNGGVFWSGGTTSSSNLTISNSVLTGSHATDDGGAVYVYYGSLQVENTTISGNTAGSAGGGIYFHQTDAPSAIRNSTISGNSTQGSFDDGGGVYINDDNPTQSILIENTTITGNTVGDHGGGIYDFGYTVPGQSSLTVESSTISGNSAGNEGGGIYNDYATTIRNTILAGNTSGDDSDISYRSDPANVAFSLIEHLAQPITDGGHNIIGQDPQLGGLASNGGATQTQLPAATSPVIDKGNAFGLNTDQRGVLRPIDFPAIPNVADGADMGAVELQPSNTFKLGKLKRNKKKGTAKQVVILPLPDAGSVTIKGKGLKTKTSQVTGVAQIKLPVIAKGKKRKALGRSGKVKIKAQIIYNATGNAANTLKRKLKLLKR